MNPCFRFHAGTLAVISCLSCLLPLSVSAITMEQFVAICAANTRECSEQPYIQAYVGGALDMIAVLDEETDHLGQVYCQRPEDFFDVPNIIRYMMAHREEYIGKNAMLPVIRYLEEKGGCP